MASMDVKQASASGNRKWKRTLRQRKLLLNEKVEVRSMEEGFLGSWHTGIVIECDKPGRRCIKYDNLLDDDECGNLVDSVCVSPVVDGVDSDSLNKHNYRGNVRPIPPKFEFNKWNIHYGQCVDVNYTDAWWEGVIFDHEDGSEERKIFFPDLGDEMLIPVNSMRITHDWDEVSGVWKQRGNWIFLELIEKYEEKLYLAVSVKQLWYDVREEKGFKKIKEWTSTFMDLWELLVFEVIEDNFKITVDELLNVIVSDGLLPETQTALESDLFVIDDNINFATQISPPESTQPIPDADMDPEEELGPSYAVVSTDQNLLNKDTVIDHEVVIKDVMDFNATGTDEPFQAGPDSSVVESGIDHQPVCSTEQGASNINSSNESNMVDQIEAICALPFNLDTSGSISDDVGIFGNVAKKMSRRIEHSMTKNTGKWMPVCQPPEPESNRNAIDQYLAHHETAKSEKLESRSALLLTLKKHISYLGWKFEYMRGKCKLVQRYVSPNGKVCYSLNEVCKHLKISSSKMECDADPTSANASISDLQLCQIPEQPLQTQDPNYSSPAVVPSEENTVSIEPEYCPQAVKEYYLSIIQNQTNKGKKDLKVLKMKARAHLVAEQWKYHCMDKGEKKYCYVSPTGVVYKSLESACGKHLLDNGSHMHKMKTRNSRNTGLKNVLEMDGKLRHSRDQHITSPRMRKRVKKAVSPRTSYQNPRTILSWLIDNNVVVPREKVSYCSRKGCNSRKDGKITCNGIKCNCCQKLFTINDFEVHAGGTNCRRTANMFLKDGRSLLDCQMEILGSLRNGSLAAERCHSINDTQCKDKNDYICSVCHYGGELMLCDQCPSSFHKRCLGLKDIPDGNWFCPSCCCGICGQSKFQQDMSQTVGGLLIACGQCERKYHRGCLKTSGPVTQVEHYSTESWFCSTTCEKIFSGLQELIGKPIPIGENNLTWTLCKYLNPNVCHTDTPKVVDLTENASKLSVALDVMHECFEPMMEPHSSRDLVEDVIFCSGSDLNRLNCEGFYTVLLESNDELITVATLRVHGQKVAEVPLVGTHVQRRRRGMCRILMNMLEKKLMELGVERLVLPAVPSLLKTWTSSFGFSKMTVSERLQFLDYTFLNFQDAIMCQKLLVKIPPDESSLMKEIQPILHHNSDFDKSSPDSEVYQAEQIEGSRNVGRGLLEISAGNNRDVLSDQTDTLVEVKQKHHLEHSSQTSNECSMDDHSVKRTDDVIDEHVPLRYYKRKRKSSVEPEAIQCSGV